MSRPVHTRTLRVQNYDLSTREFVVTSYEVTVEVDGPKGIFYLVSDGIRFAMAYNSAKDKDHVSTIVHPSELPYTSKAYEMARRIWTSCIGHGSPLTMGASLAPVEP